MTRGVARTNIAAELAVCSQTDGLLLCAEGSMTYAVTSVDRLKLIRSVAC